jgi:hypothetical protein
MILKGVIKMKKADMVQVIRTEYLEALDNKKEWNRMMMKEIVEKYGRIEFEYVLTIPEFLASIEYKIWSDYLAKCRTIEELAEKLNITL